MLRRHRRLGSVLIRALRSRAPGRLRRRARRRPGPVEADVEGEVGGVAAVQIGAAQAARVEVIGNQPGAAARPVPSTGAPSSCTDSAKSLHGDHIDAARPASGARFPG